MPKTTRSWVIDGVSVAAGAGIISVLGHGFFGDGELSIPQQIFLFLSGIAGAVAARLVGRTYFT